MYKTRNMVDDDFLQTETNQYFWGDKPKNYLSEP